MDILLRVVFLSICSRKVKLLTLHSASSYTPPVQNGSGLITAVLQENTGFIDTKATNGWLPT